MANDNSSSSPLNAIITWLKALPSEVQETVCYSLGAYWPSRFLREDERLEMLGMPTIFIDYLKSLAATSNTLETAALSIMVAALIDDVLEGRSTDEDWENSRKVNDDAIERMESAGETDSARDLKTNTGRMDLHIRVWIAEAQKWQELRKRRLTGDAIERRRMNAMIKPKS